MFPCDTSSKSLTLPSSSIGMLTMNIELMVRLIIIEEHTDHSNALIIQNRKNKSNRESLLLSYCFRKNIPSKSTNVLAFGSIYGEGYSKVILIRYLVARVKCWGGSVTAYVLVTCF